MSKELTAALVAGLLSGGLFLLVVGVGLGSFFLFLPTLPLFTAGLHFSFRSSLAGACIGAAIIGSLTDIPVAAMFLVFFALPVCYLANQALLSREISGQRQWFPIGRIFVTLSVFACIVITCIVFYYTSEEGGIAQILSNQIHGGFGGLEEEYGDVINILAGSLSFLIFSMTFWLWALALYAHLWFANHLLGKQQKARRPSVAILPFPMPNWLLTLMVLCGLASLIGSPTLEFLGKSCLMVLLFPYFLQGIALMHAATKTWPNRRFLLFFIYFLMVAFFWPVLIVAGMGLWHHIKMLNKHLSLPGSSSRS